MCPDFELPTRERLDGLLALEREPTRQSAPVTLTRDLQRTLAEAGPDRQGLGLVGPPDDEEAPWRDLERVVRRGDADCLGSLDLEGAEVMTVREGLPGSPSLRSADPGQGSCVRPGSPLPTRT